ncbi:unnamed protein product, partial [marine sediment metagenome]
KTHLNQITEAHKTIQKTDNVYIANKHATIIANNLTDIQNGSSQMKSSLQTIEHEKETEALQEKVFIPPIMFTQIRWRYRSFNMGQYNNDQWYTNWLNLPKKLRGGLGLINYYKTVGEVSDDTFNWVILNSGHNLLEHLDPAIPPTDLSTILPYLNTVLENLVKVVLIKELKIGFTGIFNHIELANYVNIYTEIANTNERTLTNIYKKAGGIADILRRVFVKMTPPPPVEPRAVDPVYRGMDAAGTATHLQEFVKE